MTIPVLVIEDNDINMSMMIFVLESQGLRALPAFNATDGLALARFLRPQLILCDIQMPGADGMAVLARLRADPMVAAIPVVAVTALGMPGDVERLLDAGFDGYLSKPIDVVALLKELARFLPSMQDLPG